jgi:hypothetical protein
VQDEDHYSSYASVDDNDYYPQDDKNQLRLNPNDKKITIDVFPVQMIAGVRSVNASSSGAANQRNFI